MQGERGAELCAVVYCANFIRHVGVEVFTAVVMKCITFFNEHPTLTEGSHSVGNLLDSGGCELGAHANLCCTEFHVYWIS